MDSEEDLGEAESFLWFVDGKVVDNHALHWNNIQGSCGIDIDIPLCVSALLDNCI